MTDSLQVEQPVLRTSRIRWREGLAALGVILSLLFVALEVRQNTLAVRASALNDLSSAVQQWLLTTSSDAELAETLVRWQAGDSSLTVAENLRVNMVLMALVRSFENVFVQGSIGVIDAQSSLGYGLSNQPLFTAPHFPDFWRGNSDRLNPEFVAEMERLYDLSEPP